MPFINLDSDGISWIVDEGGSTINVFQKRFKIDNYCLTVVCIYK